MHRIRFRIVDADPAGLAYNSLKIERRSSVYRLYVDEVGNDSLKSAKHPSEQYLCLLGVALDLEYAEGEFTERLDELKDRVFGTKEMVLHRHELLKREPAPFTALLDPSRQQTFDDGLIALLESANYVAFAVMIDKQALLSKYSWQANPYHYCLIALIERYVSWLSEVDGVGDVLAESREKKPNKRLSAAYKYLYKHGTRASTTTKLTLTPEQVQATLTSGEIKLRGKQANVAGLQLADLLASPARRCLICHVEGVQMNQGFGRRIASILHRKKYRRAIWPPYKLLGYGVKLLP